MTENPLLKKLKMEPGQHVLIMNAPEGYLYRLEPLPEGVDVDPDDKGQYDFVHLFVANTADLAHFWPLVQMMIRKDTMLWISYPKGTSKVKTDLNRDKGWEMMKTAGFEAISQVSVDEVWSALRFRPAELIKRKGQ